MSLPDMRGRPRRGFWQGLPSSSQTDGPMVMFFPDWVQPEDMGQELLDWFMQPLIAPTRADLERLAPGRCSPAQWAARLAFYGGMCWICRQALGTSVDHVKPLSRGGSNWPANLRPACRSCNASKGATWPFRPSPPAVIRRDPVWPPKEEAQTCSASAGIDDAPDA